MPRYEITSPDGKRFEITAPDGATQEQVLSYAQGQFQQPEKAAPPSVQPQDPGIAGAIGLGFGRMMDKMYQGGKQLKYGAESLIPGPQGEVAKGHLAEMAQTEKLRDEGYAPLEKQHPFATGLGETAPLLAMPMGGSLRAASAIGAIPAALQYGSGSERATRAAAGAAGSSIGYGVGKGISAAISPAMKAANPETERLAQIAAQNGIPLDAAQVTGNQVLQNAKASLSRLPWTASGQQARQAAQQEAYNGAILKHQGSAGKAATPDVMADSYEAIVSKMNGAANSTALTLDDAAVAKIASVEKTFFRRLPTDQKQVIKSYLDDLTEAIGEHGAIPGEVYNKTRSELGRLAANTDNITVREGAKGLQRALDDAFDRQAPAEAVQAMKEARKEYSRYLTTENALKKSRSTDGNIPPKQMYAQAQQDIPGFVRGGGGEFNDLVRAGRHFLPDPIPNSGTPERLLYHNLVTAGTMSGMGALGGAATGGDPISGAGLGLLGFGASKGTQRMLNSPHLTRYLMNQVLEEKKRRLIAQGGASMGLLGSETAN